MNADQTEVMTMEGRNVSQPMSTFAHLYRITGQGKSWSEKSREKTSCSLCGMWSNSQSTWNYSTSVNKEMHQR
jgi:hypothetical protein